MFVTVSAAVCFSLLPVSVYIGVLLALFTSVRTFANASMYVKDCPNCRQRKCETLWLALPQNVLQSIIHPKQCTLHFVLTQTTAQHKKWLHAKELHIKWDWESYCSFSKNYFVYCSSDRALANVYKRAFVEPWTRKLLQQRVSFTQKVSCYVKCHFFSMENACLYFLFRSSCI